MDKIEILYNEYSKIKDDYIKDRALNKKEDLKNKLIELDYEITKDYEEKINNDFPMTTTLEKEEKRLEKLILFIKEKTEKQKNLVNDYKKITGEIIELSHLKNSENVSSYKTRLDLVKKFLSIKKDITKLLNNPKESNNQKIKVLKNKLLKTEMLNLLYEFCLIDSLDIKDIEIDKLIDKNEPSKIEKNIDKQPETNKEDKKEELIEEIKQEIAKIKEEESKQELPQKIVEEQPVEIAEEKEENKILTSMPKLDKLGTVSPVNVFESIKKTEEKLPDVVIPSNGLTNENTEIFLDTKNYFN